MDRLTMMTSRKRDEKTSRKTRDYKVRSKENTRIELSQRLSSLARRYIENIRLREIAKLGWPLGWSVSPRKIRSRDESRRKWLKFRRLRPTIAPVCTRVNPGPLRQPLSFSRCIDLLPCFIIFFPARNIRARTRADMFT